MTSLAPGLVGLEALCAYVEERLESFQKNMESALNKIYDDSRRLENQIAVLDSIIRSEGIVALEATFRGRNMAQYGTMSQQDKKRCAVVTALIKTGFNPSLQSVCVVHDFPERLWPMCRVASIQAWVPMFV